MRVLNAVPYVGSSILNGLSSVDLPLTIPHNAFVSQPVPDRAYGQS
jgi:hypothetical protein